MMNEIATYNLGTVLRETGINADTLRAWERRYGLPQPKRSEGGQRLYTQHDIEIIKWLLQRQKESMRIGQAVKLWQTKRAQGENPLRQEQPLSLISEAESTDQAYLTPFIENWVSACLSYDEMTAEQVANDAFTHFSPEVAFTKIFLPSIRQIGELWSQGKVTVQQEHFASALLMRRLDALITTSPAPTRPEKMIVACPPKEEHTLSTLLLTFFLRRRGFQVVYLGTNVPLAEFKETVETIQPRLILLAAQLLTTAATLEETIRALSPCGVTVGYSGGIFNTSPAIREHISGEFLGASFDEVFANIEALFRKKPDKSQIEVENPYQKLLNEFEIAHIGIHAHLNQTLSKWNFPLKSLAESTVFLSEAIAACLYLGNLDLLQPELDWVNTLLDHRDIKADVRIEHYLRAYANSTRETMGNLAAPLVDWLEAQSLAYAMPETKHT
jgi:DNA-binding transcriptional MerR regulator/methylmalonyl-CoA mutase cobalamin-binding subunit